MSTINIPCSAVILPTKAELTHLFLQLANSPYEEVQDALDNIDKLLGNFPVSVPRPLYTTLDIPDIEWERRVTAMVQEYHNYVGTRILEIIDKVVPINFVVPVIGGLQIDLLKIWSDPSYIASIKKILCENLDFYYALVPEQYKSFDGRYGIDSTELRCDVAFSYIMSQLNGGILGLIMNGIGSAIDIFEEIWDEIGGSSFGGFDFTDPTSLIQSILADETKSIQDKIDALKNISIGPFSILDVLGGEIESFVDMAERDMNRLLEKIQDFLQEYPTFLYKEYMQTIAKFLDAIGLGKVLDFIIFDFCDFLEIIGMPKSITLEQVLSIPPLPGSAVTPLPTLSAVSIDRSGTLRYIATEGQTVFGGVDTNGNSGLNSVPRKVFVNGVEKNPGILPGSEAFYNNSEQTITLQDATVEGDSILLLID